MNIEDINNLGKDKKGGFRKIDEPEDKKCTSPSHNPPGYMYLEGGTYEYTCPVCGHTQVIHVPKITL